jgi:hypothetical protein
MVTHLWSNHTRLKCGHLLCEDPAPVCSHCGTRLATSHILVQCQFYTEEQSILCLHSVFHCVLGGDLAFVSAIGLAKSMQCMQFYVILYLVLL